MILQVVNPWYPKVTRLAPWFFLWDFERLMPREPLHVVEGLHSENWTFDEDRYRCKLCKVAYLKISFLGGEPISTAKKTGEKFRNKNLEI